MDNQKLIEMLNKDIADEHAAIIRYLVHSYLEGENTPIGASLLSRSREEMWHMHWLGMIIGRLGGEPNMEPADYPHDPTNRATIFKSYVAYEKKLVPHYEKEAGMVDDPHIRRVLFREAWESDYHAMKFQRIHDKLSPQEAEGLPGEENELPEKLVNMLQDSVEKKYRQMLQTVRNAWVLQQDSGRLAWDRMDFSMTKMKQLAHNAEEIAENGMEPRLVPGKIETFSSMESALSDASDSLGETLSLHRKLKEDPEAQKHSGLISNLDLTIRQEEYESDEIADQLKKS